MTVVSSFNRIAAGIVSVHKCMPLRYVFETIFVLFKTTLALFEAIFYYGIFSSCQNLGAPGMARLRVLTVGGRYKFMLYFLVVLLASSGSCFTKQFGTFSSYILTLKVLVATIDALGHFETG